MRHEPGQEVRREGARRPALARRRLSARHAAPPVASAQRLVERRERRGRARGSAGPESTRSSCSSTSSMARVSGGLGGRSSQSEASANATRVGARARSRGVAPPEERRRARDELAPRERLRAGEIEHAVRVARVVERAQDARASGRRRRSAARGSRRRARARRRGARRPRAQRVRRDLARPEHHRHAQHRRRHLALEEDALRAALRARGTRCASSGSAPRMLTVTMRRTPARSAARASAAPSALVRVDVARGRRLLQDADQVHDARAARGRLFDRRGVGVVRGPDLDRRCTATPARASRRRGGSEPAPGAGRRAPRAPGAGGARGGRSRRSRAPGSARRHPSTPRDPAGRAPR